MFKGLGGVLGLDEGSGPAVEEDDAATSTDGSGNTGGDLDRPIESAEGLSVPREPEDLMQSATQAQPPLQDLHWIARPKCLASAQLRMQRDDEARGKLLSLPAKGLAVSLTAFQPPRKDSTTPAGTL